MAWLTEDEFKDLWVTESATEIPDAQITECLSSAIAMITNRVKAEYLATLESDNDNSDIVTKTLRRSQSKLAYRELLLYRSSQFRSGGIAKIEYDDNASVKNEYEDFKNTDLRRSNLLDEALDILSPYLTEEAEEEEVDRNPARSTSKKICFGW